MAVRVVVRVLVVRVVERVLVVRVLVVRVLLGTVCGTSDVRKKSREIRQGGRE